MLSRSMSVRRTAQKSDLAVTCRISKIFKVNFQMKFRHKHVTISYHMPSFTWKVITCVSFNFHLQFSFDLDNFNTVQIRVKRIILTVTSSELLIIQDGRDASSKCERRY